MSFVRKQWRRLSGTGRIGFVAIVAVTALTAAVCFAVARTAAEDSDGDGMPDLWEVEHGLNPHDPTDAGQDPDFDGFCNLHEYLLSTDPQDAESRGTLSDNSHKILLYWPLMTNSVEALGTGLDGELRNGATFVDSAVALDGKDDYVNFGNDPALGVTGSVSLCV